MIPSRSLFEAHLQVSDLDRSIAFYHDVLQLPLAHLMPERRAAFFWIGERGKSMLGLWEAGSAPQKLTLHTAFETSLDDIHRAAEALRAAGVTPLDFDGDEASEPVVLAWMPAASIYFHDPDGNLLEFISILSDPPRPDLGVIPMSRYLTVR
jgi:catechol 2,3-dioxygenase-like lactoylglutathione lyase family enzyme